MTPAAMKEAHVYKDSSVTIQNVPVPTIQAPHNILVKVLASGVNPKDWKMPAGILTTIADCPNSGDDIAGIVEEVGSTVKLFRKGDRVAGLHELGTSGGSFAEYAILPEWTTFHLPEDLSFEQAATVPMAALMAAVGFFGLLKMTAGPWAMAEKRMPLVVYGASSAMGGTIVRYAKMVNIHPLICIVGQGGALVEKVIEPHKGDVIVDYRKGDEALVEEIRRALLPGEKLQHAFDAVSAFNSWINIGKVLDPHEGKITLVLPRRCPELHASIEQSVTMAGSLFKDLHFRSSDMDANSEGAFPKGSSEQNLGLRANGREFAMVFSRLIGVWLENGKLPVFPFQVEPGGLAGLEGALKSLRSKTTSGFKHVIRIADTPGVVTSFSCE